MNVQKLKLLSTVEKEHTKIIKQEFLRLLSKISHQIQKEKFNFLYLFCFGSGHKFKKMDQKFPFGELNAFGNSCVD